MGNKTDVVVVNHLWELMMEFDEEHMGDFVTKVFHKKLKEGSIIKVKEKENWRLLIVKCFLPHTFVIDLIDELKMLLLSTLRNGEIKGNSSLS